MVSHFKSKTDQILSSQIDMLEDHLRRKFFIISYTNYVIFSWRKTKTSKKPTWKERNHFIAIGIHYTKFSS